MQTRLCGGCPIPWPTCYPIKKCYSKVGKRFFFVGLLSKSKESVELFRVDHFDVLKPMGMRLAGHCLLDLRSSDTNFANVILFGVPDLEVFADTLRECSLRERTRRRVTTLVQG